MSKDFLISRVSEPSTHSGLGVVILAVLIIAQWAGLDNDIVNNLSVTVAGILGVTSIALPEKSK
jgi:hypothetical protein